MEEEKKQDNQELTYEKLLAVAEGLRQQNEQMKRQLQGMQQYISEQQTQSIFAYLEAAFKVVANIELFDSDFAGVILDDIKRVMNALRDIIVPKENEEQKEEDGDEQPA